jgi:chaperonin cofactor prefoldin
MVVMLVGIGFLSVLTASIASVFIKTDRGSLFDELSEALTRIELELADLRRQLAR